MGVDTLLAAWIVCTFLEWRNVQVLQCHKYIDHSARGSFLYVAKNWQSSFLLLIETG